MAQSTTGRPWLVQTRLCATGLTWLTELTTIQHSVPAFQSSAILDRGPMSYHVVAFTMAQVRRGALEFQRQLGAVLRDAVGLKVYSPSPFDLEERRRAKDRFGGDIVYFFNDVAHQECSRLGLNLQFVAEIPEEELPRRRTLVVGVPE